MAEALYVHRQVYNKGMEGEFTSIQILFEAYQAGENAYAYHLAPYCAYIFDSYEDSEVLEAMELTDRVGDLIAARLEHHQVSASLKPGDEGDVLLLSGPEEKLREKVKSFIEMTANEVWEVGGDDSYFDYYPDNFFILAQIAPVLGLDKELQAARDYVKAARYDDEEGAELIG